jgi:hypothetical protein
MDGKIKLTQLIMVLGGCLILGPAIGGYLSSSKGYNFLNQNTISVMGESEREVKANHGDLLMEILSEADDLAKVLDTHKRHMDKIISVLKSNGFQDFEIQLFQPPVTSKKNQIISIRKQIHVITTKIDLLTRIQEVLPALIDDGVVDTSITYDLKGKEHQKLYEDLVHESTIQAELMAKKIADDLNISSIKLAYISFQTMKPDFSLTRPIEKSNQKTPYITMNVKASASFKKQ